MINDHIIIRDNLQEVYSDVYTPEVLSALSSLARFNKDIKEVMALRLKRRAERLQQNERIAFLDPDSYIPRTNIRVQDARDGKFDGAVVPADLQRQWIQGTGPAAKPNASVENSIRNVSYALLSGADGWMFDGEYALGQIKTMSLDNQRNLKLAISKDPVFMKIAQRR
jgi:malate synthase